MKKSIPGEAAKPETNSPFPIVGIGASAGGLAAFEQFFSGMPVDSDPGMAFILVQHLAPDHKSLLTDLIQRYTRMQVFEVKDGIRVKPNCAYIIPPARDMAFLDGALHLLEPAAPRGQRLPIDFFFKSLAQDLRERAICVILSGTGSDGTQGVRAIKAEGGMAMVQSPETTEYDGMPRCALATGLVDYESKPKDMPAQLIAYAARAFQSGGEVPLEPAVASGLKKVFVLLRSQTGHDFSQYKPNTIQRRIERRIAVHQIQTMDEYVRFLQQTPKEVEALFRDLLIGVTGFFRDPQAFKALEDLVIPSLVSGREAGSSIRIWTPGCSTGEEAYSIAILLKERIDIEKKSFKVSIFATDIDGKAIATARAGIFPAAIAADIAPERLSRFFTVDSEGPDGAPGAYRVHKSIRDMLVFSEQDMIKDPPFSRLDLITCRNLLIYMGGDLQKKVIPLFHYALRPGGCLFLGTSESLGESSGLFVTLDRKAKLYKRKEDTTHEHYSACAYPSSPSRAGDAVAVPDDDKPAATRRTPFRELTEQALLKQLSPVGALVNASGDIRYLHGKSGLYLEPQPGEPGLDNILKMARTGLRHELTTALFKCAASGASVASGSASVKINGLSAPVRIGVHPVSQRTASPDREALYLVVLEEGQSGAQRRKHASEPATATVGEASSADLEDLIRSLRQELSDKEEYITSINEELETSNEELKSSNEEMQSVNEELQSTNEELETSKEELQSVNEELTTVNTELQTKVADLTHSNNDMNNLLAGTGIGTVFVDHGMRILRFTPAVTNIINLIQGDVGRPVGHIVSNLVGYDSLVSDLSAVLGDLVPRETEVQTKAGSRYVMHMLPYRTLDNVIEGAVITFVDVTEARRLQESAREALELLHLSVVVRDSSDAMIVQGLDGRILAWNPGAQRMYGWTEAEAMGLNSRDMIPEPLRAEFLQEAGKNSQTEALEPYKTRRLTKAGETLDVSIVSTSLIDANGRPYAIATTERAYKQGG